MTSLSSNVLRFAAAVIAIGAPLAGCGAAPDGQVGFINSSVLEENSLSPNALSPNALSPNALSPNALSPNALTSLQDTTAQGTLNRQLLKYTVSCALRPDQSFSFSWTDAQSAVHNDTYWGLLGLASEWGTGPLPLENQEWISACLASRLNYFGVTVMLSARGGRSGLDSIDSDEATYWNNQEGAFWGNAFANPANLYTCYKSANINHSRALNRTCSSGVPDGHGGVTACNGLQIVGDCDSVCANVSANGYYGNCTSPTGTSGRIVTVFLQ